MCQEFWSVGNSFLNGEGLDFLDCFVVFDKC